MSISKIRLLIVNLFFLGLLFSPSAQAILRVEITSGMDGAQPIAVIPFARGGLPSSRPLKVSDIITGDLLRSGRFAPMAEEKLLSRPADLSKVNYKLWRLGGIDHLVIGKIDVIAPKQYQIQFRLLDVYKGQQVLGYQFLANDKNLRGVMHHISDLIYEKITGQKGAFDTKVAFITVERKAGKSPSYQLQVADTDGYNPQTVLVSTQPMMSPSWSPDGSRLAYVSFEHRKSEIYIQNLSTRQRQKVSSRPGINGAPVWSPDGKKLALTLSKGSNTDIYILDLATKKLQQVTRHWSIDTGPSWMPDGDELIFTSSRSGNPQLYRISVKGGKATRLTFDGKYNASPEVSPDGSQVAFIQGEGNQFKIAVMDLQSGFVQTLTDGPLDESPSFAPNGSMIIYAAQYKGRGVLAEVSTDGRFKQRLVLSEGDVREPEWGPFKP